MTFQQAAEQGLRELRRLHIEAGECSHPHECPVVKAITDLELALQQDEAFRFIAIGYAEEIEAEPMRLHPETLAAIGRMRCHGSRNASKGQESCP